MNSLFAPTPLNSGDPFYKVLYVMEIHRMVYRVFYVALYVMILHRVDYRMSLSRDLD